MDWPKWPQLILMTGNVCERLDRWTDTQDQQTLRGGGEREKKALQHQHKLTLLNSSKPEHTAVLIMVHDTLEYCKNDLHESPLKLLCRIYMDLTCKLTQLSSHGWESTQNSRSGWKEDGGKLEKYLCRQMDKYTININAHQRKNLYLHLNMYEDVNP